MVVTWAIVEVRSKSWGISAGGAACWPSFASGGAPTLTSMCKGSNVNWHEEKGLTRVHVPVITGAWRHQTAWWPRDEDKHVVYLASNMGFGQDPTLQLDVSCIAQLVEMSQTLRRRCRILFRSWTGLGPPVYTCNWYTTGNFRVDDDSITYRNGLENMKTTSSTIHIHTKFLPEPFWMNVVQCWFRCFLGRHLEGGTRESKYI